ncbi:hypothetical protein C8R45DRAFT_985101 [Mycena sanguinolenta]|nr:hypothetical protein C8R45DRAFT_985101 [Mycena sanguinolenta]
MPTISEATYVLSGWDLGVYGDLVLQGVIFAQFAHYTALYKKDIFLLRAFVWGLLFLTTLKSAQGLGVMWSQNVEHFTDVEGAVGLFENTWFIQINVSFVAVIGFYVQMFFCYRLWVISKNIYMVGLIVVLFVFALLSAFVRASISRTTFYNLANGFRFIWGRSSPETSFSLEVLSISSCNTPTKPRLRPWV